MNWLSRWALRSIRRIATVLSSHISLGHAEAWRIDQALIQQMGVLPDFRKPDNIPPGHHAALHRVWRHSASCKPHAHGGDGADL
ncbi:MAG: hypothetical protein R2911_20070 [Caldilineaceae bacterium]